MRQIGEGRHRIVEFEKPSNATITGIVRHEPIEDLSRILIRLLGGPNSECHASGAVHREVLPLVEFDQP